MPWLRAVALALAAAGVAACGSHDHPAQPDPCAFSTAGARWMAFASGASGSWDIGVVRADGTCRRAVTSDAAFDASPAWGPGGALAFESDRAPWTSVWITTITTAAAPERRLDVGTLRASGPAFSPDGSRIAFEGRQAGLTTGSIYVVPVAGGTPLELTPEAIQHGNGLPAFSPDGASIYFVSNRSGGTTYDVYRVSSTSPSIDPERVTTGSGLLGRPAVSPDGRTLAYTRSVAGVYDVALFDPATGTSVSLGVPTATEPAFDPAGGRIAVRVAHAAGDTIDLVPLPPGAGTVPVTTGSGPDGAPAFAPLGP